MLYPELFRSFERVRWDLETDIPWDRFDASLLTDEQIRACASTGGVVGINGLSLFLGPGDPVETLVRHIEHVAELLALSVRTIESHRANLMGKLGLSSRVELVTYAEEHGLL